MTRRTAIPTRARSSINWSPIRSEPSAARTGEHVESVTPGTFLHELQHMINNGQHVLIHHGQPEEGWLDEGESIVATELGARYYDVKYPPPSERTSAGQLFPDSAEPFIPEQLNDSYNYLTEPDTASLTLHTDADCCLAWRAGDWLLLRYVGDQFDSTVYARLDQSNITGTANLAHATGIPFAQMFANFGLALYTDSIPGVARAFDPGGESVVSYNLRQLYDRLYTDMSTQWVRRRASITRSRSLSRSRAAKRALGIDGPRNGQLLSADDVGLEPSERRVQPAERHEFSSVPPAAGGGV